MSAPLPPPPPPLPPPPSALEVTAARAEGAPRLAAALKCSWPRCAAGTIREGSSVKRCGACLAPYCSRVCMAGDMRRHKAECAGAAPETRAEQAETEPGASLAFASASASAAAKDFDADADAGAPAPAPAESSAATAERLRVEALPTRALKAELAARDVSMLGLSERRDFVEALLGTPQALPASKAAAAVEAAHAVVASAGGRPPANIRSELAALDKWLSGALADNEAAAERGDAAAQCALGRRHHEEDLGVSQDFELAARWFRKAADQGFAAAQLALGAACGSGLGVAQSDAEAVSWLLRAAAQSQPEAQATLGLFHELGDCGLSADRDEAARFYKLAAASGLPLAVESLRRLGLSPSGALICRVCFALPPVGTELQRCSACKEAHYCGAACQRADWGPRHKVECGEEKARQAARAANMAAQEAAEERLSYRALADIRRAADRGESAAQSLLGNYHFFGEKGLVKSPELAVEWWLKAAAGGHARSQGALGCQYDYGDGVKADKVESVRLYRQAARQGFSVAMLNLALALNKGEGCERDKVQAAQWLRRAAELGFAKAQTEMAGWYFNGDSGVPINFKEGLRFARLGAAQGNAVAAYIIGVRYAKGEGVEQDLDEACRWWRQGASKGDEPSRDNLRDLGRSGFAPAIAAVRELGL